MGTLLQDVRYAVRTLTKSPGFTTVAVLTLALGIGANTAIFSFVNALLLRDLPVQTPERLVWIGVEYGPGRWDSTLGHRYYELLRDTPGAFSGVAAMSGGSVAMTVADSSEQVHFGLVSGEYFHVLGVPPAPGRVLLPKDDVAGAERVLVLRHSFWRSRFGADPAIIGSTVTLAGQPYTVVGVAPPGFHGIDIEYPGDLWVPLIHVKELRGGTFDYFNLDSSWLQVVGRVSPGVSQQQATAAAATVYSWFGEEYLASRPEPPSARLRERYKNPTMRLEPVKAVSPYAMKRYRDTLSMLAGAVGFLLLIACANVASLLLARCVRRRQEFAVRTATGASRWRLVRQLLAEGGVLAVLAGALGVLLSWNFCGTIVSMMNDRAVVEIRPDPLVLGFTLAVSLASLLVFALIPALTSSSIDLASALKGTAIVGKQHKGFGSRGWFVALQFALCLPLLVGAGLLIRSVENLYSQDVGFKRKQRIQATINPGGIGYDEKRATALFESLLSNLAAQPGLQSVAYSSRGTLTRSGSHRPLFPDVDGADGVPIGLTEVSEGYFETLGIPLVSGRDFVPSDDDRASPVVIINQKLAHEMFGNENPLGRQVRYQQDSPPQFEIVGVAADSKYNDLRDEIKPVAYFPFRQRGTQHVNIYFRTEMGVEAAAALLRDQVRTLEPHLPVTGVRTLDEQIESQMGQERIVSTLLSTFGFLALILTAVGLYAVVAFDVGNRTREVGLRLALGAQRRDIFGLVFRRAALWVLGGAAVGVGLAAALSQLLEKGLFGLSPLDPSTFVAAVLFLLICAALANYLPSRRAARVDPMTALRYE